MQQNQFFYHKTFIYKKSISCGFSCFLFLFVSLKAFLQFCNASPPKNQNMFTKLLQLYMNILLILHFMKNHEFLFYFNLKAFFVYKICNFCLYFLIIQKNRLGKIMVNKQLQYTYCPISHQVKATRQSSSNTMAI